ncbi:hypothetical protein D3C76_1567340 [compost metagenome]
MLLVIAVQCGTAAGVARVEEEVLHVDRDELLGAARFIEIRAAGDLAVVLFPLTAPADVLWPAGEVQQPRIIAESEAAVVLTPAFIGKADQPGAAVTSSATLDQRTLGIGP